MHSLIRTILTFALVAVFAPLTFCDDAPKPAPSPQIKETLLAKYEKTEIVETRRVISPDGRHIAFVKKKGNQYVVMHDGVEDKTSYPHEIRNEELIFSPDSQHLAYRSWAVIQGAKDHIDENNARNFYVIDGVVQKDYAVIGMILWSPDSKHYVYPVGEGKWEMRGTGEMPWPVFMGDYWLVRDGVECEKCAEVKEMAFSPDSQRLAYISGRDLIIDGKKMAEASGMHLGHPMFSPDSKRWSCVMRPADHWYLNVDGVEYNKAWTGGAFFSPDSKRLAYLTRISDTKMKDGDREFMVIDDAPQKTYDSILSFIFSPDSRRYAYQVFDDDKYFVVLDGAEGPKYADRIWSPTFSPDSKHFAYVAIKDNKRYVVSDGVEGPKYDGIDDSSLSFSPDSSHLAYIAMKDKEYFVVMDGKEIAKYPYIAGATFVFSPDSKHYAYIAAEQKKGVMLVIDGIEAATGYSGGLYPYHGERLDSKIVYDSPTTLHCIMHKEPEKNKFDIVLVEVSFP